MGTDKWTEQFLKTFHPCFNITLYPRFPDLERLIKYNSNVYFMSTNACPEDCNGDGLCTLGRCTCKNGLHGLSCNLKNCPNSLVFVDIDVLDPQHCYHCSQRGICYNGTCDCDEPYMSGDCSTLRCLNNCSNTPTQTFGECFMDFPQGHCKCNEWEKRGGDDCSYQFCLNECSEHGKCIKGEC
jgi:tenascin